MQRAVKETRREVAEKTRRARTAVRVTAEDLSTPSSGQRVAPSAIHALHSIVGNQAMQSLLGRERPAGSGALAIQRNLLKPSEVRQWIKWVSDPADRANSTRCMLAIYNQMRLNLDPTPAPFRNLADARRVLIARHQIDHGDVDALEAEAARSQQAGGDPAETVRLRFTEKIASKYNAVDAKYGHHIFQGDIAGGTPTGFHSKADGSATHEAYGRRTDVGNGGAYQQSVRTIARPAVNKPIQSTFFPDNVTHQHVIEAIASVYEAGLSTVNYVDATVNGMRLATRGDTVFPAGGSDQRTAE